MISSLLKKSLGVLSGLMLMASALVGQITGPTSVQAGTQYDYYYNDGTSYYVPRWTITNGTVISSDISGVQYHAVVQWTSSGTLNFQQKSTVVAALNVTVCSGPTAYNVGGGGTFCSNLGRQTVTLSGSQSGVNYQLYKDGTASGSAVAGTGGALSWPNQRFSGTYTIAGTQVASGCTASMNGSAVINYLSVPIVYSVTGDPDIAFRNIQKGLRGSNHNRARITP